MIAEITSIGNRPPEMAFAKAILTKRKERDSLKNSYLFAGAVWGYGLVSIPRRRLANPAPPASSESTNRERSDASAHLSHDPTKWKIKLLLL